MTRAALFERHQDLAPLVAGEFFVPGLSTDDVVQEARIAIWQATATYDPELGSFRPYARLAARRQVLDLIDAAARYSRRLLTDAVRVVRTGDGEWVDVLATVEGGRDPLELVILREQWERMCAAAKLLSERERAALEAVIVEGRAATSEKWIDNGVQRARRRLREAA